FSPFLFLFLFYPFVKPAKDCVILIRSQVFAKLLNFICFDCIYIQLTLFIQNQCHFKYLHLQPAVKGWTQIKPPILRNKIAFSSALSHKTYHLSVFQKQLSAVSNS